MGVFAKNAHLLLNFISRLRSLFFLYVIISNFHIELLSWMVLVLEFSRQRLYNGDRSPAAFCFLNGGIVQRHIVQTEGVRLSDFRLHCC